MRAIRKPLLWAAIVLAGLATFALTYAGTTGSGTISVSASSSELAEVQFASSGQPSWAPLTNSASVISAGDLYTVDTTAVPYTGNIYVTLYLQNGANLAQAYSYFQQAVTVTMNSSQVTSEAVGTGNGATTAFALANAPVSPEDFTVYVAGSPQTEGTNYTVNYATGVVTFTVAPGGGAAVTADYWYNNPASGTAYKQAPTAAGTDLPSTVLTLNNGFVSWTIAGDSGGGDYKISATGGSVYTIDASNAGNLSPTYYASVD